MRSRSRSKRDHDVSQCDLLLAVGTLRSVEQMLKTFLLLQRTIAKNIILKNIYIF